ncbi:hypothetical protein [Glutamicibacter sp. TV12E]|uniref:hypothetical protein n=1 Tax=Glutamicibacter sp. TV12E TaxID=3446362 RepID=UPI004034E06D
MKEEHIKTMGSKDNETQDQRPEAARRPGKGEEKDNIAGEHEDVFKQPPEELDPDQVDTSQFNPD